MIREFTNRRTRPRFKEWLNERFNVDLTHSGHIEQALDRMNDGAHRPVGELTRKVSEILSHLPGAPPSDT